MQLFRWERDRIWGKSSSARKKGFVAVIGRLTLPGNTWKASRDKIIGLLWLARWTPKINDGDVGLVQRSWLVSTSLPIVHLFSSCSRVSLQPYTSPSFMITMEQYSHFYMKYLTELESRRNASFCWAGPSSLFYLLPSFWKTIPTLQEQGEILLRKLSKEILLRRKCTHKFALTRT